MKLIGTVYALAGVFLAIWAMMVIGTKSESNFIAILLAFLFAFFLMIAGIAFLGEHDHVEK